MPAKVRSLNEAIGTWWIVWIIVRYWILTWYLTFKGHNRWSHLRSNNNFDYCRPVSCLPFSTRRKNMKTWICSRWHRFAECHCTGLAIISEVSLYAIGNFQLCCFHKYYPPYVSQQFVYVNCGIMKGLPSPQLHNQQIFSYRQLGNYGVKMVGLHPWNCAIADKTHVQLMIKNFELISRLTPLYTFFQDPEMYLSPAIHFEGLRGIGSWINRFLTFLQERLEPTASSRSLPQTKVLANYTIHQSPYVQFLMYVMMGEEEGSYRLSLTVVQYMNVRSGQIEMIWLITRNRATASGPEWSLVVPQIMTVEYSIVLDLAYNVHYCTGVQQCLYPQVVIRHTTSYVIRHTSYVIRHTPCIPLFYSTRSMQYPRVAILRNTRTETLCVSVLY